MKVLVTYVSQTGNTRKVAQAIFDQVKGSREMKELQQVTSLDGCDLAFVGFPIQASGRAKPAGVFDCQGELSEQVAEFMIKSGDEKLAAWDRERPSTIGLPDEARLERARQWARGVLAKVH